MVRRILVIALMMTTILAVIGLGSMETNRTLAEAADLAQPPWELLGPVDGEETPLTVHSLALSSASAMTPTLFVAATDGIYRSQDGGAAWQRMLTLPSRAGTIPATPGDRFSLVRLSPAYGEDATLYAGLNQQPEVGQASAVLYRSADGGQSWEVARAFTETLVSLRLSPDFANDQTLFAFTGYGATLHRSQDGGDSWGELAYGEEGQMLNGFDMALSPDFATDETFFISGFGAPLRTRDGGQSWQSLPAPGPNFSIALSPDFGEDETLWMSFRAIESAGDGSPESAIVFSTDGGDSWGYPAGLPGAYEPFPRYLALSPHYSTDRTLFTGLSGQMVDWLSRDLFCSPDGGESWLNLGALPGNPDIRDLAAGDDGAGGVVLYAATDAGVWRGAVECAAARLTWLPVVMNQMAAPTPTPTLTPTGTPTVPPTATPTATLTVTPTPTSQPPASCYEGLINGGFELNTGWEIRPNPVLATYVTAPVHTGARSMRTGIPFGGANVRSYSPIQQAVNFPASLTAVELRFWRYTIWGDATRQANPVDPAQLPRSLAELESLAETTDFFYVLAIHEDGTIDWLHTERATNLTWRQATLTLDVSRYAGQAIRLQFGTFNNGAGGISRTFIDDVRLTLCLPGEEALILPGGWVDRIISQPALTTLYATAGGDLYRSANAGLTWARVGVARPEHTLLSPADGDRLYAGAGYPCFQGGPDTGFWRSDDGGASWQALAGGTNLKPLAAHPADPDRLWAAGCDGPYLSTNGGITFTRQSSDLFGIYQPFYIAPVGAAWTDVWLAGISEGGGGAVLVSRNGGVDWSRSTPAGVELGWLGGLALDRGEEGRIYAPALNGFFLSPDDGASWQSLSTGLADVIGVDPPEPPSGLYSLIQESGAVPRIFLGTARGLYVHTPDQGGDAWLKVTGQPFDGMVIRDLDLLDARPTLLYVTTGDGVYRYTVADE